MSDTGRKVLFFVILVVALACGFICPRPVMAQTGPPTPPAPTVDPLYPNVFYGAVNPSFGDYKTPVLVFVPGLGGVACDWYSTGSTGNAPCVENGVAAPINNMYAYAYQWGYRTAFISPNTNNTPATSSIQADGTVLQSVIPRVSSYFNAPQMYFIGHSKGGLDLQQAILDGGITPYVKGIFTVATPNQGTALATWAFLPGSATYVQEIETLFGFNLDTPAIGDMTLANMATFRAAADPVFQQIPNKPFFYFSGDGYGNSTLTAATGSLLLQLVPGTDLSVQNDGLVTVGETQLPPQYSNELGVIQAADHFQMNLGSISFSKIRGRIEALETETNEFQRIAVNGLTQYGGSPNNTWIWSAAWFNNKLYIGTGSQELCLSLLTSDVRTGTNDYPTAVTLDQCPSEVVLAQSLSAQIWEYTPSTSTWRLAYQSAATVPTTVQGTPVNTAVDVGYRGMYVYTEMDGTPALYVGTVTSGGAFEPSPFPQNGWPPPRILRTTDGQTWTPIPQDSGTFLGNIGNYYLSPTTQVRSFRSIIQFNGQMFVTAASYEGSGIVIASSNPSAGDNSFQQVSPNWSVLPVWDLAVFNNYLYAATGFLPAENPAETGYGMYKTAATGTPPYTFLPIITDAGNQTNASLVSPNGLQLWMFRNELYMATAEPSELLKVRADDSWDLVVGQPRPVPTGQTIGTSGANGEITPLAGIGAGLGNWFNGHFWRMTSITGAQEPDQASAGQNMFLGTWDWSVGIQEYPNVLSLDTLYTHQYGTDVYRTEDGVRWSAVTQGGFGDPNNSGTRTLISTPMGVVIGTARQRFGAEVLLRTAASTNTVLSPRRLRAQSGASSGQTVNLAWDPPPGAVFFNIYRAEVNPTHSGSVLAPAAVRTPEGGKVKDSTIVDGSVVVDPASFPYPYNLIAQTNATITTYSEHMPTALPSLYYVRTVDANGNLSDPSNIVAGPSQSAPIPVLQCDINGDGYIDQNDVALITESIGTPVYGSSDPRDANSDGQITSADATLCTGLCTKTGCLLQ